MGNALRSHENLKHVHGWTADQIDKIRDTLRVKYPCYVLTKEEFVKYFGGRNRESVSVFNDLDTDYDGRVDLFEILVTVILWSTTTWTEKQHNLFRVFDFNSKASVRLDELLMFLSVGLRTLKKFVHVDSKYEDLQVIQAAAKEAFKDGEVQIDINGFCHWFNGCPLLEELMAFIDDHARRVVPEAEESPMRKTMCVLEKKCRELSRKVEQLRDQMRHLEDDRPEADTSQRKRFDFMIQNLHKLVVKLQRSCETQRHELAELTASLNEDASQNGMGSLVDPRKRFRHEQMLMSTELVQSESQKDFQEAADLLGKLIELVYGKSAAEIPPEMKAGFDAPWSGAHEAALGSVGGRGNLLGAVEEEDDEGDEDDMVRERERLSLREAKRGRLKKQLDEMASEPRARPSIDQNAMADDDFPEGDDAKPGEPIVVAIADFDPPRSHETQMLAFHAGDEVIATGQDGKGWWYGRKRDGTEGWFPPSYVQLKKKEEAQQES
jgi:Ca2+-binding EF-hand superfamily protein